MTGPGQPVGPLHGLAAMALSAAVTFVGLQTHHVLLEVLFDRLVPRLEDRHQPDATDSGRILNA